MRSREKLSWCLRMLALLTAGYATVAVTGCGMTAAPQPPSLELPTPVTDLRAFRNGDQVALTWTMPKRDTSHVDLKGEVTARVCRKENGNPCTVIGNFQLAPGANGTFNESLPGPLASGEPRPLDYFVELLNKRGRSAGQSNAATVLEGQAPAAVMNLSAEVRKDGIVLHWAPEAATDLATVVRLERTLLTPAPARQSRGLLAEPEEPARQTLLVPAGGGGVAIDKEIRFGESYQYRAQRIARATVNGKDVELAGPFSSPVSINAENLFAPAVPGGLAAVAVAGENGQAPVIDLNWQPDTDSDLAGYAVYRRGISAEGQALGEWQRISPAQPVVGPGFHDGNVAAGHSYEYAVTAIGQNGRESEKSVGARESVP